MVKRKIIWYGFDMLSVYLELTRGQLAASKQQLQHLELCENKPHVLDDYIIARIIKLHSEQIEASLSFKEQCNKWREQTSDTQQLADIAEVENNIVALDKTNKQVLDLANRFKNHTIERVLAKNDIELAFDFLSKLTR